jgi:hypothetical protein
MSLLGTRFGLEVEFHRLLRAAARDAGDAASLHTSYALQTGYEGLLVRIGPASRRDLEVLRERLMLCGDQRDVLAARDSLAHLLGRGPVDPRSATIHLADEPGSMTDLLRRFI